MKSLEKFYNFSFGIYSGFLIREKRMKKLAKIITRQEREIREFLAADLDALEISDWTLAYPDGKEGNQHHVNFYRPSSDEEKLSILDVSRETTKLNYYPDVFIAESMKDAEKKYLEWWESENEIDKED